MVEDDSMSIATYADLQAAVARWLARPDLTGTIPDYILMFEQAANRRLRVREQEAATLLTPAAGVATLPIDYLSWRRVTWAGSTPQDLEYLAPNYFRAQFPVLGAVGPVSVFTIQGSSLLIATSDTTQVMLHYFQEIPALSDPSGSGTNWLLSAHPDCYLFGSLCEAHGALVDLEKAAFWKARRDETFQEIETLSNKTRGVGGMRVYGPTP
jgi:hypothetical protein